MADHARLSPSAASIWMACPGMPVLAEGLVSRSSEFSERGTAAHELLEIILRGAPEPADYKMSNGVTLDDGDLTAVKLALDFIDGEIEHGDEWEMETQLKYSDDLWGTCDFNRYRPSTGELLVVDYKHGAGIFVDAFENPQGVIYALLKAKSLGNRGISTIRFVIIQPRHWQKIGEGDEIQEFVVDGIDMLEWEDKIVEAVEKTRHARKVHGAPNWPDHYLNRGKHCRWCPANFVGGCPLVEKDIEDAAALEFTPGYDVKKLAAGLAICERADAAIKATRSFAYTEADNGVHIPGFKLVNKKAVERWNRKSAAVEFAEMLGAKEDEIYEPKALRSPAQLRAALEPFMDGKTKKARTEAAKNALSEYTEKVSSGTTLVPDSDPRPAAKSGATSDFEPITD